MSCPAETQAVVVVRQDMSDQLAVAQALRLVLHRPHQLPADTVVAELSPHKHAHFADVVELWPPVIALDGDPTGSPNTQFGHQDGVSWNLRGPGMQTELFIQS